MSSIRELKLRLRLPEEHAERANHYRQRLTGDFAQGVFHALEAAIKARLGDAAIVWVRRLPLRLKLSVDELEDYALRERLGQELAQAVLTEGALGAGTPMAQAPAPDAPIVAFDDEAHYWAVVLAERAQGRRSFYAPAVDDAPWQAIARLELEHQRAVVERLLLLGTLDDCLRGIPPELAASLSSVPPRHWPLALRTELRRRARGDREDRASGKDDPAHADGGRPPDEEAQLASAGRSTRRPVPDDSTQGAAASPTDAEQRAPALPTTAATLARSGDRAPPTAGAPPTAATAASHDEANVASYPTAFAGAFWFVARVLELEIAEHLWCVGSDEGPVVAHALRYLAAAPRDDLLFACLACGRPSDPLDPPGLEPWAAAEVIHKTQTSLGRALARRGDVHEPLRLQARLDELALALDPAQRDELRVAAAIGAAVSASVCARLDVPWSIAVPRALAALRGKVTVDNSTVHLELPLAAVNLDVRRAGLDTDPGWIPWLSRHGRMSFVAAASDVA